MLARISFSTARRVPASTIVLGSRFMSNARNDGSVASSKEFGKREAAQETEYVRKHEAELLRKLKSEIEAKKAELAALELQHAETEKKKGE